MRMESGPIFVRPELPQPSSAAPFRLRPIVPSTRPDPAVRLRQITPARLAVEAKASAGSGLIDLDEVARALVQDSRAPSSPARDRLLAATPFPEGVVTTPVVQAASSQRALLRASLALLAVLAALLAFLAVS